MLAAEDIAIAELDIGGGYGIAYTEADHPVEPAVIARNLAAHMTTEIDRLGIRCPRISIEPGRSIAGPAGLTIYTVGTTKTVWVEHEGQHYPRRYVAVDGGMSDNPRPVLYDADYTAVLANRVSDADVRYSPASSANTVNPETSWSIRCICQKTPITGICSWCQPQERMGM